MSDSIVNDYEAVAARMRELEKPGKRAPSIPLDDNYEREYQEQMRAAKLQMQRMQGQGRIPGNYNVLADDDIKF